MKALLWLSLELRTHDDKKQNGFTASLRWADRFFLYKVACPFTRKWIYARRVVAITLWLHATTEKYAMIQASPPMATQESVIGLAILTIEGGALCYQEIGRQAFSRGIKCPSIVAASPPSGDAGALLSALAKGELEAARPVFQQLLVRLVAAGATFAIIPVNTAHLAFERIADGSPLPLVNILDVVAGTCRRGNFSKVGVMGTGATMRSQLYDRVLSAAGIECLYPQEVDINRIDQIIFEELIKGRFTAEAHRYLASIAKQLEALGAQAIILGCTELPLVMDASMATIPFLDSTQLLAIHALDLATS